MTNYDHAASLDLILRTINNAKDVNVSFDPLDYI